MRVFRNTRSAVAPPGARAVLCSPVQARSAARQSHASSGSRCKAIHGCRRHHLPLCRPGGASPPAAAAQAADAATAQESPLQSFLRWLLANGVQGVGAPDSKIALFEGEGGERGVVSLHPIAAGEVVMRIPLRLAITDQVEEGQEASAEAQQPWSVRLAGRLLGMLAEGTPGAAAAGGAALQCQLEKEEGDMEGGAPPAAGDGEAQPAGPPAAGLSVAALQAGSASPWQPYLAVLPASVPSPLTNFSWEDVQAIEYPPMRKALDHASWLAASAAQQPGGSRFSREQWEWALSVVHSRTFGAPGPQGGVGVRMLVPLIDMLNHAGDYVTSPPGAAADQSAVQAFDSVRWELRAPAGPEGEWTMEVAAARDVPAGEELLLSYGERANDDFFLHYGFVPPRNPHDQVALFTDIESAIDWWLDRHLPPGALPPLRLQAAINAAYSAAEEQDGAALAASQVLEAVPAEEAEVIRAELDTIKLSAGGMVDGRLLAAYRCLYEEAAAAGVRQHAGSALGGSWGEHVRLAVGARCRQILQGMPTPLLDDLQRLAAWESQTGQAQHCWSAALQQYSGAVAAYEAQHGSLHEQSNCSSGGEAGSEEAVPAGGAQLLDAGADAELAKLLLAQARQAEAAAGGGDAGGGGGGSMLPLIFRTYKKLQLWDAVLAE